MSDVLVACEFSGIVRDAFTARGHSVVSCDLLTTERPGPHAVADVLGLLDDGWDLLIAHPPCTHLAVSGARWFAGKEAEQVESLGFIQRLLDAPIERIALENPVGIISTRIRKPDQIVQPWQFGDDASKKTCWWLKNLPPLVPTGELRRERYANQRPDGQNRLGETRDRWKHRSRTYPGMAAAMADQWGGVL